MMTQESPGEREAARELLGAALRGRAGPAEVAEWAYAHPDLARVVGYADEEDLLAFDYLAPDAGPRLLRLLRRIALRGWPGDPRTHEAAWRSEVLEQAWRLLAGAALVPSARRLADLALEGEEAWRGDLDFAPIWGFVAECEAAGDGERALREAGERHRQEIEAACRALADRIRGT